MNKSELLKALEGKVQRATGAGASAWNNAITDAISLAQQLDEPVVTPVTHAHLEECATEIRKAAYPSRAFSATESWNCARAAYNYLAPLFGFPKGYEPPMRDEPAVDDAMVERVARALYANNPATRNGKDMSWEDCYNTLPERMAECKSDAKAAIAAMKEGK